MGPGREASGGSAGNTAAGLAALGIKTAFIGQVADDQLGEIFAHDIRSLGVAFDTPARGDVGATARCLILVTPDAQRTMNTFLGAAQKLSPDAIDWMRCATPESSTSKAICGIPKCRAPRWKPRSPPRAKPARRVAFTLSDSFCRRPPPRRLPQPAR